MKRKGKKNGGFTVIELVITAGIIAVLLMALRDFIPRLVIAH